MNALKQLKIEQSCSCPLLRIASETKQFAHLSELELVIACQQRRSGAIDELLQRYNGAIRNIVYRLAPECRETDDICQSAQIKVWHSIASLRQPKRFRAWLKRLVSNLYYDDCRRSPKGFFLLSLDEPVACGDNFDSVTPRSIADPKPRPEAMALRSELLNELNKAIASVPSKFTTAMLFRDEDGLTYDEIALLTKTGIGTVKSRISRGRAKVQEKMASYMEIDSCAGSKV